MSSRTTREAPGWYADNPEQFGVKLRYHFDDSITDITSAITTPPLSNSSSSARLLDMGDSKIETGSMASSITPRFASTSLYMAPSVSSTAHANGGATGPYPEHLIVPGVITVGMASISNLVSSEDDLMGNGAEGGAADPIVIEELACKYLHSYNQQSAHDMCGSVASDRPSNPLKSLLCAKYEKISRRDSGDEDTLTAKVRSAVDACQWNSSVAAKIGLVGHASIWMALMTLVPAVVAVLHRKKRLEESEAARMAPADADVSQIAAEGGSIDMKSAGRASHHSHSAHLSTATHAISDEHKSKEFDYNDHSPYGSLWQLMFAVDTTRDLLTELIDCGDCQHFVTCCEVFREIDGGGILDLLTEEIGNLRVREGYVAYLDMLNRLELFALANEYIRKSKDSYISRLSQTGVIMRAGCAHCGKEMNSENLTTSTSASWCQKCKRCAGLCVFCHQPVRGLLHWCPICGHGGHISCTQQWFENHVMCPSGCGHRCIAHGVKQSA